MILSLSLSHLFPVPSWPCHLTRPCSSADCLNVPTMDGQTATPDVTNTQRPWRSKNSTLLHIAARSCQSSKCKSTVATFTHVYQDPFRFMDPPEMVRRGQKEAISVEGYPPKEIPHCCRVISLAVSTCASFESLSGPKDFPLWLSV